MAAISCDGEVGDGAEVAAGETLGGFAEGGVGLDAERCGRLDEVKLVAGIVCGFGFMTTVLLPMGLFSCRRCAGVCCTAAQDFVECCDGCIDVLALEDVREEGSAARFRWCG